MTSQDVLVIGHRGAPTVAPANTVAAFAAAADVGADWVEMDVHATADGNVVVHHDATLADGRPLARLALDELPTSVPALEDVLVLCASRSLGVNIEIKSDPSQPDHDVLLTVVELVLGVVRSAPVHLADVLVSSFDPACIARWRALDDVISTAQLVFASRDVMRLVERVADAGHAAVNPVDALVDAAFVAAAHERGLAVYPWTVDDPARLCVLVEMGVDGIITNRPDVLRAILAS